MDHPRIASSLPLTSRAIARMVLPTGRGEHRPHRAQPYYWPGSTLHDLVQLLLS